MSRFFSDLTKYDLMQSLSKEIDWILDETKFFEEKWDKNKKTCFMKKVKQLDGVSKNRFICKSPYSFEKCNTNTEPLLKRAFMFLEDGKWNDADEYCEKVLDLDPENARAYLGKLMAELNVKKESVLKNSALPFDNSDNYQKTYRFADSTLRAKLDEDIKFINARNEEARKQNLYNEGKKLVKEDIQSLEEAISVFKKISGWKDVDKQIESCKKKIEEVKEKNEIARKDDIYRRAANKSREIITAVEVAIELYKQIPGWKDAESQLELAKTKLAELNAKKEEEKNAAANAAKSRKKAIKIIAIVGPVVAAVIVFLIVLVAFIIPNSKYNSAMELYEQGKYEEAMENFNELGGFKDSAAKLDEIKHKPEYIKMTIKQAKAGDTITFGRYGNKDLKWQVLDKQDNMCFVISKGAVTEKEYNEKYMDVTWETCTLRGWLNGEFLTSTFTDDERKMIKETTVENKNNPMYQTEGRNNTQDKIFLLSIEEAETYFKNDEERVCKMIDSDDACLWWLRSPGSDSISATLVYSSGNVTNRVDVSNGVRPALWINLES